MEQDGVDSYYLQDDLGSVLNLVGKNGEGLEEFAYEEFGQVRNRNVSRTVQPFAFTGYQMDEVSRLYFAQARRYDARNGRFVSEDKVRGFVDVPVTLNHYGYCWNRPTDLVDLDGNIPTIVVGAIIGGVVGGVGSIVSDMYHWRDINWKEAGINTLKGAAGGAVIGTGVGAISYLAESAGVATTVVSTMNTGAAIGQRISSGVNAAYQATSKEGKMDMGEITISGAGGALSGMLMGSKAGMVVSVLGNGTISATQSIGSDVYTGNYSDIGKDALINFMIGVVAGRIGGTGACYGNVTEVSLWKNIVYGLKEVTIYSKDSLIKKAMLVSSFKALLTTFLATPAAEFLNVLKEKCTNNDSVK